MEVAHGPQLTRTYTAPHPNSRLTNSSSSSLNKLHHQSHTGSTFSAYSNPSASSNSTASLFPQPPSSTSTPPPANGAVVPTNNVINKVADKGTSLYRFSVLLSSRIAAAIPDWENELALTDQLAGQEFYRQQDQKRLSDISAGRTPPPFREFLPLDPVAKLWRTFARGYTLIWIYNVLEAEQPLPTESYVKLEDPKKEENKSKLHTYKFLRLCIDKLGFAAEDCFIVTDLYLNNTSGFVKVANVVNRITDIWIERGIINSIDDSDQPSTAEPSEKKTQRTFIVDELVRTERTYVHHLEVLHSFQNLARKNSALSGEAIHDIFLNLNALLDFQRRFLICVEQVNDLPVDEQDWGSLFIAHAGSFQVYEPYIANQKKCEETALREFDKLRDVGGSVELQQLVESPATLNAFLLKPFQRLSKYPLLLKDLREKGELDEQLNESLTQAIMCIQSVLERTNSFIASLERAAAVRDLKARVDDWKSHRVESFGDLLLHGEFEVYKLDSSKQVRLYQMYLFQKILVCCKEIAEKQKGVKMSKNTNSISSISNGKPRLALKGRIFMQNVVETTFLSKPGNYSCRLSWRTEWMSDNIESFVVKFKTEEVMRLWRDTLEKQRTESVRQAEREFNRTHSMGGSSSDNSSQTELLYMQQQGKLENPNKEDTGEEDEVPIERYSSSTSETHDISNHHESFNSIRSRSTTGESTNQMPMTHPPLRGPPTKQAPLTLKTQQLPPANSGTSYFSPVAESPISSRTSSSSGFGVFTRQPTPQNGWYPDESNRFTAPAHMARNMIKDSHSGTHYADPRAARASQAPPSSVHPNALAQTRMRSASSPDVSQNLPIRGIPINAPPVPSVPSYLTQQQLQGHNVNRNNSSSPFNSVAASRPDALDNQWEADSVSQPASSTFSALSDHQGPTNFKVKVEVPSEGSTMMLVVGYNISYQSLKDRIDAKLQRATGLSLTSGDVRLQYLYDDEMVSIQTDEDVQTAFETWKESQTGASLSGQLGEIRLFCNR